ncbi:hypothetical protein pEaSNUABM40_00333 [Erwinia phage pEa_SNUABM_40]|uniref:Uncharacterized protein n=1 Tax=Erwinia phage pEa_SNUABM_3 TaxID=2869552 RepID=A0AAE7XLI7_9CAUD|nr:hypothetical protein MPK68_gp331 [Erwinia phage pEa_SNUABM_3]QZE56865.1 hypothetical protein pEaSNUABM20_00329 [Erwinia phage pEa_SNUABM_20]QZE58549.1 hypothetical protein pEaSNUABM40_00333 [Erwinia phage pEa_SNUABM_40]UAW53110.1 hypothetical protein pEaSNUABM23_00328 [Erwinia phage pEa_SNUABM_23]UIW11005.1 hypothetical protein pEaSNUABM23_00328 [Erwinia phage pEa_SNUABM_31]QZE56528.1 hypothetical protein pEaSNUABM3_00331 [Erwinia phage pEa_SNUABM_3]
MGQKLSEQINRYFNLMEKIREQMYRVLPVSNRYLCVVSFSTQLQALQCVLVSKESLMEAKLIEGLTGQELITYGQYMRTAEEWVANGMQDDYPFTQDKDVYEEYRSLTRDEQMPVPEMDDGEEDDLDVQEMDDLRTSILCADKATLMQMFADEGLGTKGTAADMDVGQLQDALCDHYGLNPDVGVKVVDVVGALVERLENMPKHEALKEAHHLTKEELLSLADAWGIEKDAHESTMRSLIKGHILRRT